nr:alpha/beta hydrolase [Cryptosporangium phraense]
MSNTSMVSIDDTALAVTDTGGTGTPVVYLNGQFATQGYWRRVIDDLGPGYRHITYDERARGKHSKRSADYSPPIGRPATRRAPRARSWSTARSRTTGSTTPWSCASGSCSDG